MLRDVFTDDVTADRSNGMNSDVCGAKLSAWIPTKASKLADFTVQMDKDYNHTAKQPKSFSRQRNGVFFSGHSHVFTSRRQNWRQRAVREGGCSKDPAKHLNVETQGSVLSLRSGLLTAKGVSSIY